MKKIQQSANNSFYLQILILALLTLSSVVSAKTVNTYYHNNLQGSVVMASNDAGTVLWRKSYRPYGESSSSNTMVENNKVSFTGFQQDNEAGLMYAGARWYNPEIGRFISIDPVRPSAGNTMSLNRYAYANNNPYRYVDPDGRAPKDIECDFSCGLGKAFGIMLSGYWVDSRKIIYSPEVVVTDVETYSVGAKKLSVGIKTFQYTDSARWFANVGLGRFSWGEGGGRAGLSVRDFYAGIDWTEGVYFGYSKDAKKSGPGKNLTLDVMVFPFQMVPFDYVDSNNSIETSGKIDFSNDTESYTNPVNINDQSF